MMFEAHAEHGKKKHGRGQNRGHHDQRNDRDLEIAQEREQHDRGKRKFRSAPLSSTLVAEPRMSSSDRTNC